VASVNRARPVVMRFTGRETEMDRRTIGIHHRVNLTGQAASRAARVLVIVVGHACPCCCTRTTEVSIICTALPLEAAVLHSCSPDRPRTPGRFVTMIQSVRQNAMAYRLNQGFENKPGRGRVASDGLAVRGLLRFDIGTRHDAKMASEGSFVLWRLRHHTGNWQSVYSILICFLHGISASLFGKQC
jgi:hypothetical protein